MTPSSNALVSYQPHQVVPYQGGTGWNSWNSRPRSAEGEILVLVWELAYDHRELRKSRRLENERRMREERGRVAKDAEMKRIEEEARKKAEKEARLAKMMDEKMKEIKKKREEDNRKLWEKIVVKDCETAEGDNPASNADKAKNKGQDEITGVPAGQPSNPRQRVNEVGALDAGLLLMNIDNVQRAQAHQNLMMERTENQQNMMFERVIGLIEKIEASNRSAANPPPADHVQAVAVEATTPPVAPVETAAGGSRAEPQRFRNIRTAPTAAPLPVARPQPQPLTVSHQPQHPTVVISDEQPSDQPISPPAARSPVPPNPPIPPQPAHALTSTPLLLPLLHLRHLVEEHLVLSSGSKL
ncbi:hypothetical protein CBR_g46418 [Chara braunii]|uniref:Uncharacterized protein n=1 Tax=Chara braunii TaxID=69332 RepID=A0A388M0P3_CHABU|nr:hypothetical protein CBR_g46418 [Chara braunii]|eukprot:GBG88049.1 hypothetical protein CBR_g46418 [Chara braunii]